jgi:phosphate transport system substrate-binding protein
MTRGNIGLLAIAIALIACGGDNGTPGAAGNGAELSGTIQMDGSSTVYPISQVMAEEFNRANPNVRVTVGNSGTGGGFKRFCANEIEISDASRPIKDSEKELCTAAGVEWVELKIAMDGLAVVVNPANTFVECLTTAELKKIWEPASKVTNWSEVRAGFPNKSIKLYGPGTNSGTFDYFTAEINGKEDASRSDYTASEEDNVLVQGVAGDADALGYFGYGYVVENAAKLKVVGVDSGTGCVKPDATTVKNGTYKPLSRPLYIYVKKSAITRPEVDAFVRFYLEQGPTLVSAAGYVPLDGAEYTQQAATMAQPASR